MSLFIEMLRRNYLAQKITLAKIEELVYNERITREEKNYIIGEVV